MISNKPFRFIFKYNKGFALLCANNGDGKTRFLQKFMLAGIPKEKVHVLNTSHEPTWIHVADREHIYSPKMYSLDYLEQFIVEFAAKNSDCLLVISDADAFGDIKHSDMLYKFVREARHMNIGLIIETALLQKLPTVFFQQATHSFFGPQENIYNVQYISKANIPAPDAEKLLDLPKYVFGCWVRDTKEMYFVTLSKDMVK